MCFDGFRVAANDIVDRIAAAAANDTTSIPDAAGVVNVDRIGGGIWEDRPRDDPENTVAEEFNSMKCV